MHEYDCLLLEHVFGQRPDDAHKVRQFVLETIASDPGLQQTELVFLGLFGRACRVLEAGDPKVTARPSSILFCQCLSSLSRALIFSARTLWQEISIDLSKSAADILLEQSKEAAGKYTQ